MEKPNNPPAFPTDYRNDPQYTFQHGMTLRDYFAAKAMQGFASRWIDTSSSFTFEILAKESFVLADAMLAEREKGE